MLQSAAKQTHTFDWERLGFLYARIALGAASCPESPTGLASTGAGMLANGNFDGVIQYTAKVNSFMPPATIPFLAWADTGAGEFTEKTLSREGNEVREFYAALEGSGAGGHRSHRSHAWFLQLLEELGIGRVGDRVPRGSSGEDSGSRAPETGA